MTRILWYWLPPTIWATILFVLSAIPGRAFPVVKVWNIDKFVHFGAYAVLGALLCRAAIRSGRLRSGAPTVLFVFAAAAIYGVTDELHQLFVAGRSADWRDAVADALGGLIGALVWKVVADRQHCRQASVEARS